MAVAGMVSAYHPGNVRARLLDRTQGADTKKGTALDQGEAEELMPLTVPAVRRLLWRLAWSAVPDTEEVLAWSHWRRRHQARAKRFHIKRRAARFI
jgi:hypothetical protein